MVYANLYFSNLKIKYVDICSFVNMLGTDFVIFQRILSSLPICYVNIFLFDQNVVNSTMLYMRNMYSSNLIDLYVDLCHDIRQMVPKWHFCRIQFCHSLRQTMCTVWQVFTLCLFQSHNKRAQNLPLVLGAPQDAELGTMLVVGVPPASDTSRKKLVPDTNLIHVKFQKCQSRRFIHKSEGLGKTGIYT